MPSYAPLASTLAVPVDVHVFAGDPAYRPTSAQGARVFLTLVSPDCQQPFDRSAGSTAGIGDAARRALRSSEDRWPTAVVWPDSSGDAEILLRVAELCPTELREAVMAVPELFGRLRDASDGSDAGLHVDLRSLGLSEENSLPEVAAALVEGLVLGCYTAPHPLHTEFVHLPALPVHLYADGPNLEDTQSACGDAVIRGSVATLARTLTDLPPSSFTPAHFAEVAGSLALQHGWQDNTLGNADLRAGGFGGILSVGNGSSRESHLIDLAYLGRPGEDFDVVLVGKGVTMDCGGMNLKVNRQHILAMKSDMASGAAAVAALLGATKMALPINVRVLVPAVENLPGPAATLPGDVVRHRGGITTEVTNTDAEGRMLLADGLAYASENSPQATVITIGTLMELAIGPAMWPVVSNDAALSEDLRRAGAEVGEVILPVPTPRHYDHHVNSRVADLQNFSFTAGKFDLLMATTFMSRFSGNRRWAHIDVCETAFLEAPWGSWPVGATGSPSRTLLTFLRNVATELAAGSGPSEIRNEPKVNLRRNQG